MSKFSPHNEILLGGLVVAGWQDADSLTSLSTSPEPHDTLCSAGGHPASQYFLFRLGV